MDLLPCRATTGDPAPPPSPAYPPTIGTNDSPRPCANVLAGLRGRGFAGDFFVDQECIPPGVRCGTCGRRHLPGRLEVVEAHRVEVDGTGVVATLFGVSCPRCATAGVLHMVDVVEVLSSTPEPPRAVA